MAGFIENRKKYCIRLGNLQKDRFVERHVYTSLREIGVPVKVVRRLEVLNNRDFINQSVVFVYLHEGNDNRLEEFALRLDGIEFEHATNYFRRLTASIVEAKELPFNHRNLQPHQGATVKVTMSNGKVTAIEDDKVFEFEPEALNNANNNNNYDDQDDRTEDDFRDEDEGDESEKDESDEDESEDKQLVSSQQQETPTTSSQPEPQPTPPETPTTTESENAHPTSPKNPPTKAENIADRVERLEKEIAELKRQVNRNNNNKSPEYF